MLITNSLSLILIWVICIKFTSFLHNQLSLYIHMLRYTYVKLCKLNILVKNLRIIRYYYVFIIPSGIFQVLSFSRNIFLWIIVYTFYQVKFLSSLGFILRIFTHFFLTFFFTWKIVSFRVYKFKPKNTYIF